MKTADGKWIMCDGPEDCGRRIKNHYWGSIKNPGWLHLKNGESYCPAHHPSWVAAWRKKKK